MKTFLRFANSLVKRTRVVQELQEDIYFLNEKIKLGDAPFELKGGEKFFLPYLNEDGIQRDIYKAGDFTAKDQLKFFDDYFSEGATILDVGANLGNHAIYWARYRNAKLILCFEPIPSTFENLSRNIEVNGLGGRIEAYQVAMGDQEGRAKVDKWSARNRGATVLAPDPAGDIVLTSLDSAAFVEKLERVDVLKIDVEGFEGRVISGARKFISSHKPVIFIEIFKKNFREIDGMLAGLGYEKAGKTGLWDYVYLPK